MIVKCRGTARVGLVALVSSIAFAGAGLAAQADEGRTVAVVARGLDNPRGLDVAADGTVYVAEAGRAGPRCFPGRTGADERCVGFSGAITRIAGGKQERVATGFLSLGGRDGSFTVGVDDVALAEDGRIYAIMSSAGPHPEKMVGTRGARQSGTLLRLTKSGYKAIVARADAYEFVHNPAGRAVDSDPYSLAVAGGGFVVADAGANTLLAVAPNGRVSLLAVWRARHFGGKPVDTVPTSVAVGPDGAYYVGELGGDGTPDGEARIWRVVPGEKPKVFATGFTTIVGLDVGPDGTVYVVELLKGGFPALLQGDFTGALIRIAPDGSREELAPGKITAPGGVAVGPGRKVYVTVNSVSPGQGEVLQVKG